MDVGMENIDVRWVGLHLLDLILTVCSKIASGLAN
jgi:hypothetical protein